MNVPKVFVDGVIIGTSVASFYVANGIYARIDALVITNPSAGAIQVTIHLVPPGGSPGNANRILSAFAVPAGVSYVVPGALGQWLAPGGTIQAVGTTASVALRCSGVEYS